MFFKKVSVFFICIVLIFTASGCKSRIKDTADTNTEDSGENYQSFNLLYCANDTFDPYTLTTKLNAEIAQLIYDPLYKLDNNFEPIAVLAQSSTMDGNVWTITVKDALFSDNSKLTADDVVFSCNLAKNCARYKNQLSSITSMSVSDNQITFTLNCVDPYFLNVLTFPVIKTGSNALYDSDSVLLPPIGTGRYTLSTQKASLVRNENYHAEKSTVVFIKLKNAPDNESINHYVEVGATDFFYADSTESSIARMSAKKASVNRNVLVYLGINDNDALLSNINMRYAISAAISRDKIVSSAFFSNAVASTGPFHPAWKATQGYQTSPTSQEKQISIENLEKIGYNKLNTNNYRVNALGQEITLSLLVNKENASRVAAASLIVSSLAEVGLKVNLVTVSYPEYIQALENGNFQLYLGEVKLDNNFDISPLVIPGGSCAYQKISLETDAVSMQSVINDYKSGKTPISNVITAVQSQMPFIPICYRSGIMFYNETIADGCSFSETDLFLSIDRLTFENQ